MSDFCDKLAHLVNTERMDAVKANDPARIAQLLERLAHVTGWTIAIEGQDTGHRSALSEGVCALIYETATGGAATVAKIQPRGNAR